MASVKKQVTKKAAVKSIKAVAKPKKAAVKSKPALKKSVQQNTKKISSKKA